MSEDLLLTKDKKFEKVATPFQSLELRNIFFTGHATGIALYQIGISFIQTIFFLHITISFIGHSKTHILISYT